MREALPAYQLHGTKGSFIKAKTDVQEAALQAGSIPGSQDWGKEPESEKGFLHAEKNGQLVKEHIPSLSGNYMDYFESVYQSIRNGAPIAVTADQGLQVIRIINAAFQSSRERRVVEVGN